MGSRAPLTSQWAGEDFPGDYVPLLSAPSHLSHSHISPAHFAKLEPHVLYGWCGIQVKGFFWQWVTFAPAGSVANSPAAPDQTAFRPPVRTGNRAEK